jgi:hypothetical protein
MKLVGSKRYLLFRIIFQSNNFDYPRDNKIGGGGK